MNTKWINMAWGMILIAAGGLLLARELGYISMVSPQIWAFIFTGLSLLFFASYFAYGVRNWGWLFPAFIFGSLAITLSLAEAGFDDPLMAAPILASVGIPFYVAFGLEPRQNWWALIPAWVMTVLTLIVIVVDRVPGEVIGSLFLLSVSLPFLVVFLLNRSQRWALIPAFVLGVLGAIVLLSNQTRGEYIGALVLFAIALPFFVVYFLSKDNWWALIPAGVMGSLALITFLVPVMNAERMDPGLMSGVLWVGIGLTFLVLWRQRQIHPTRWAIYPALGCGLVAIISFVAGAGFENIWPVVVIAAGIVLLFFGLRPKKVA
jgi:hypothetical protein